MTVQKVMLILLSIGISVSVAAQQQSHGDGDNGQQHGGHGQMKVGEAAHGQMNMSRARHHFARDNAIGESYQAVQSPLVVSEVDMSAAKTLYDDNCASCHGVQGLGDGVEGAALDPVPTNIARFAKMKMARDDYLLWTLSEGGKPVMSAMPAFKNVLTRDEIWQVIAYLRQL